MNLRILIALGSLSLVSAPAVFGAANPTKFHPGHYMLLTTDQAASESAKISAYELIAGNPNILGVQIRYHWSDLEATEGNFSGIIAQDISDLKTYGGSDKRLIVQVQYEESAQSYIPSYVPSVQLPDGFYYPVLWESTDNNEISTASSLLITLLQHIASKQDGDANLEAVNTVETATGYTQDDTDGYSAESFEYNLQQIDQAANDSSLGFVKTLFMQYVNFMGGKSSLVPGVCANAVSAWGSFGGPDIDPTRTNIPAYASYPTYSAYFYGNSRLLAAVQGADYNLAGSSDWTYYDSSLSAATNLFNFSTSKKGTVTGGLYLSYICWLYSPSNWTDVTNVIGNNPWPWYP